MDRRPAQLPRSTVVPPAALCAAAVDMHETRLCAKRAPAKRATSAAATGG